MIEIIFQNSISLKSCTDRMFQKYIFKISIRMQDRQVFLNQGSHIWQHRLYVVANRIRSLACCLGFIYLASVLNNLEVLLRCFSTTLGLYSLAVK